MKLSVNDKGGSAKYSYDDFTSGLIPQGQSNNSYSFKYNGINGFAYADQIDSDYLNGILSPGQAPTTNATGYTNLAGIVQSISPINNNVGYAIDAGGKVQYITNMASPSSLTIATGGSPSFPHTIAYTTGSGAYVGQDTLIYKHNYASNRLTSMFFTSYRGTSKWGVGILTNYWSVFEDEFLTNSAITNYLDFVNVDSVDITQVNSPHPMEIGADGLLYIGSGRYIHGYDGNTGTTGTYYSKVLTLPEGTTVIGMKKFQNMLLIAVNFDPAAYTATGYQGSSVSGMALVYTWDYLNLDVTTVIDCEDNIISAISTWKGNPIVVTQGAYESNGSSKVKVISGNSVIMLASFDGILPTNRGLFTTATALYMNCGGDLYRIGSKFKQGYMVVKYGTLSSTGNTSGAFINLGGNFIGSTSNGGSPYYLGTTTYQTLGAGSCRFPYLTNLVPQGKKGRVVFLEVEYYAPQTATTGGVTVTINTDTGSSTTTVLSGVNTVTGNLLKRYTRDINGATLPSFSNFDIGVSFTTGGTPIISKIVVEYELLEITN